MAQQGRWVGSVFRSERHYYKAVLSMSGCRRPRLTAPATADTWDSSSSSSSSSGSSRDVSAGVFRHGLFAGPAASDACRGPVVPDEGGHRQQAKGQEWGPSSCPPKFEATSGSGRASIADERASTADEDIPGHD